MTIQSCDQYFTTHIAGDEYFVHDEETRKRAMKTAETDLASCGADNITENSPEMLRSALFEQTLFVLKRKDKYSESEREVASESVEGVGSCRYTPSGCPVHISIRAYALVDAFFRVKKFYLARG